MRSMTTPLETTQVLEFEFIGTAQKAIAFLSALEASGQLELLTRSIFLDCVFLFLYGATFYFLGAWICSRLPERHVFNNFRMISISIITAVICDLLENLSMLGMIYYPPQDAYAYLAFFFAAVKFTLLGLVLIFFILSGLVLLKTSKEPVSKPASKTQKQKSDLPA